MDILDVYQPAVVELGWSVTLLLVVLCLRLLSCRVDRRIVILLPLMWGGFSATASVLDALSAVRDVAGVHLSSRRAAAVDALGFLGVGAAASSVVGVVAGVGGTFASNRPHVTRAGSWIVVATGSAVGLLGFVLWLVTREAGIGERALELAGRTVQLATAGVGAVAVIVMMWRAKPGKQPLTRWSILGMAAAAAGIALTCLFCATRLQPARVLLAFSATATSAQSLSVWFKPDPADALSWDGVSFTLTRARDEQVVGDLHGAPGAHQDLTGEVVIRKELVIPDDIPTEKATAVLELQLYEAPGNAVPLHIVFGGEATTLEATQPAEGRYTWREVKIPIEWIRPGSTIVTLKPARPLDVAAWAILTRRSVLPNRSAVSVDGGRTWNADRLANDGSENGEFAARLRIASPAVGRAVSGIRQLAGGPVPSGDARVNVEHRSGPSTIPAGEWTAWIPASRWRPRDGDRYVQSRVEVAAGDVDAGARLAVRPPGGDLAEGGVNAWLPYGSRFQYQDPGHPRLAELRRRENLDRFASGADEDLLVARLRDWARRQFPDGDPNPYPPLDAVAILDWIRAGRTQGFCGQHAYVLGQALLSFGFQVRYVELGMHTPRPEGAAYFPAVHFAVEYWSPSRARWVFTDPNKNLSVTLDGRPLSALQIHDLYIEYFDLPMRANPANPPVDGDPRRVRRLAARQQRTELGTMRIEGWELQDTGRLEVWHGPTESGPWSLEHFYYLRVRLRNDELMQPTQDQSDLPAVAPRLADRFNPNGMLEFEDARCLPLREPLAVYTTRSRDVFNWPMNIVSVSVGETQVRAATTWPFARYRLRTGGADTVVVDRVFPRPPAASGPLVVEVLDAASRIVASSRPPGAGER